MKANLDLCQEEAPRMRYSSLDNRKTPGRPEGHKSHLHRFRESLRSGTEGGDLEMHEGAQRTRKVC